MNTSDENNNENYQWMNYLLFILIVISIIIFIGYMLQSKKFTGGYKVIELNYS